MKGLTDESVGSQFDPDLLTAARDKTLRVIEEAARRMEPGLSEKLARSMIQEIQEKMGAAKSWHPPQIRFGENTVLPFGKVGREDVVLQKDDIFFFDIGPIFDGHEGDVGRAFTLGSDPEMKKCCIDAEKLWQIVRDRWAKQNVRGPELYEFATAEASRMGWVLSLEKAEGHRIADFPHIAKSRGSIEGFAGPLTANRWILEIQIRHPHRPFGAFYEDLLN